MAVVSQRVRPPSSTSSLPSSSSSAVGTLPRRRHLSSTFVRMVMMAILSSGHGTGRRFVCVASAKTVATSTCSVSGSGDPISFRSVATASFVTTLSPRFSRTVRPSSFSVSRPSLPPPARRIPPKARAMPPTFESYQGSGSGWFDDDNQMEYDDGPGSQGEVEVAEAYNRYRFNDNSNSSVRFKNDGMGDNDDDLNVEDHWEALFNPKPDRSTPADTPPPRSEDSKSSTIIPEPVRATFPSPLSPEDDFIGTLVRKLESLEKAIYAQNNGTVFNIHSPKQVSLALFGDSGQSTNKETLEAMGGSRGNVMADLILQHRRCARDLTRAQRKKDDRSNGTHVTNVNSNGRPARATVSSQENVKEEETPTDEEQSEHNEEDPLLLVDASAYIFRAYFSMPPLHRADGMPIGALLGFCNMLNRLVLNRLLKGECPRLVLVFDAKGKTFRHDLYDEYKSHRPECPMDLIPQFDLIREAAAAYGIYQLEANSFEADDVIATLATMALAQGIDSNILSGDKDLMQLVTPEDAVPSVHMIDPMSMSRVTHDVVVAKWGVGPEKLGDVLALAGDSSDNVPGVPGIGPKIAASLLEEFGTLDGLLENVDKVRQKGRREKLVANQDKARLSRQLVELERAIPRDKMTFPPEVDHVGNLRMEPMDPERLLAFYEAMGMRDLKRRFQVRLDQQDRSLKARATSKRRAYPKKTKTEIPQPEDYEDVPF